MPRGTLASICNNHVGIQDAKVLNVHFATLSEYAHDQAIQQVLLSSTAYNGRLDMVGTSDEVMNILQTQYTEMSEFIRIDETYSVTIGVNRTTIDDSAMQYGMELLLNVANIQPNCHQTFGSPISLKW